MKSRIWASVFIVSGFLMILSRIPVYIYAGGTLIIIGFGILEAHAGIQAEKLRERTKNEYS